jgi:hypothetical protein
MFEGDFTVDSEQAEEALLSEIKKFSEENPGPNPEFILWSAIAGDGKWGINSHAQQLVPKLKRLAKLADGWWVRQKVFLSTRDWISRYEGTPTPN